MRLCRGVNSIKRFHFRQYFPPQSIIHRGFANEVDGAGTSTGIEHALKFNQIGQTNKQDFQSQYKCIEYLHQNTYSYYDIEVLDNKINY